MVIAIIISISAIIITSLLCFKGITFHKKMEIVPTKTQTLSPRSPEMDEIEKRLNEVDRINNENAHVPHDKQPDYTPGVSAMDHALKAIHDVFGPEQPPEVSVPTKEINNG